MARFQPSGTFGAAKVIANNIYRLPVNQTPVIQAANNNRSKVKRGLLRRSYSGSPGFQTLDALITSLDAIYEQLLNQAAWAAYAGGMVGHWQLCANCVRAEDGKKIYRQYNVNRQLLNLARDDNPPGQNTNEGSPAVEWVWLVDTINGIDQWSATSLGIFEPMNIIGQIGAALNNPIQVFTPGDFFGGNTLGPVYTFLSTCALAITTFPPVGPDVVVYLKVCECFLNGEPSKSAVWTLRIQHVS